MRRLVAIWGAGETGRRVWSLIHTTPNINIEHVVDSDPTKWGKRFSDELFVEAPSVLADFGGELFVAAAGGEGAKEGH